jgi:hypothetical protein
VRILDNCSRVTHYGFFVKGRSQEFGVRSQEFGVQESGVRSSGVRSQESGVRSSEFGVQEFGVRSMANATLRWSSGVKEEEE